MNWATQFCFICHIHLTCWQPTTTSSSSSTTFCRQNASTTIRRQKMLSRVCRILNLSLLSYSNKLISCWQNMLIVMVPILINKDVFEPSYNDLKYQVQNHNYFFINLICEALRKWKDQFKQGSSCAQYFNCPLLNLSFFFFFNNLRNQ